MKKYSIYGFSFAIVIALIIWFSFAIVNLKNQKDIFSQFISEKIGYKIDLVNDLKVKLLPFISLETKDLSIKNSFNKDILTIDSALLHIDFFSIFKKQIIIKGIKLEKPKIFIKNLAVNNKIVNNSTDNYNHQKKSSFMFNFKRISFREGEFISFSNTKNIANFEGEINIFDNNILFEAKSHSNPYKVNASIKLAKQKDSFYEINGNINLEDDKNSCGIFNLNGCCNISTNCLDLNVISKNISLEKNIKLPYKLIDLKNPISYKSRICFSNNILKISELNIDHIDFKAQGNAEINLLETNEKRWLNGNLDFNLGSSNFNSTFGIRNSQLNENKQIFEFNINNKNLKNFGRWFIKDVETPILNLPCNILGSINFNQNEISCGGIQINLGDTGLDFYFSNVIKNCQIFSDSQNQQSSCKDFGIKISTDLQKVLKLFQIQTLSPIKSVLNASFKSQQDGGYETKGTIKIGEEKSNLNMIFNLKNFSIDNEQSFQDFIKKLYGNFEIDGKNFDLNIKKIVSKNKDLSKKQIRSLMHIKNINGKLSLKEGLMKTNPNLYGIVATKSKLNLEGGLDLLNKKFDFKGEIKPINSGLKKIPFTIKGDPNSTTLLLLKSKSVND